MPTKGTPVGGPPSAQKPMIDQIELAAARHVVREAIVLSGPLDMIALDAAAAIDDEFARHHAGGATQRTAKVQRLVTEAIKRAFDYATKGLTSALAETKERS